MTQIPPQPDSHRNINNNSNHRDEANNLLSQLDTFDQNKNNMVDRTGFLTNGKAWQSRRPSTPRLLPQGQISGKSEPRAPIVQWFYDLPIRRKQIAVLLVSEVITIAGLAGVAGILITNTGQQQLENQAKSELAVTEANYAIKVDQMGFGFRGQSENSAIIRAAQSRRNGQELTPELRNQVKDILVNEIRARRIEYATLVGTDGRIIVNANQDRTGETFDPNGWITKVLENPQQIKTSEIVSWSELSKESPPLPESVSGKDALIRYTFTPVRDPSNGSVLGILVSGDLVNGKPPIVENTLRQFDGGYSAIYQRQSDGEGGQDKKFVLAVSRDQGDKEDATQASPNIPLPSNTLLNKAVEAQGEVVTDRVKLGNQTYAMAAKAIKNNAQDQNVAVLVRGTPETELSSLIRNNLLVQGLVVILALLADFVLARVLGRTIAQPISKLKQAAQSLTEGNYTARTDVHSQDELGQLASAFNQMAGQLEKNIDQVENQEAILRRESARAQLVIDIAATKVDKAIDAEVLFDKALEEARIRLGVDRIVLYHFNQDWSGSVVAESIATGWLMALNEKIEDACIPQELLEAYRNGRVVANNDIYTSDLHPEHLELMERLQIKANLIAPINNNNELSGLLIAHHCASNHEWQESEINFLQQLAVQLGNTLDRATFLEQLEEARQAAEKIADEQRQLKENLQKRALELLMEVDPVSKGDLTIRATVTADEVGTIADSYNATIESLRKIVTQVQDAAQNVAITTTQDEAAIQSLSDGALSQTQAITDALDKIQAMAKSTRVVATNAEQAETAVRKAARSVAEGDEAMNRTVDGIIAIRETVAGTAKKVKRLGESSQKISKVVNLISSFAAQTNLLALNASIEAARAGEDGRGFGVVADEVRSLATQSAEATAEIEKIVAEIQMETNEVVAAMESGTEQVVMGTKLVDETRQRLNQITEVSAKLNQLVESIAQATVEQSQTSESVTRTITEVADIAQKTSTEATQVSTSFKQLLEVAQDLQGIVGQFKVK